MAEPYQECQPILPYPSRKSVAMAVIEMIGHRSGLDMPTDGFYSLGELDEVQTRILYDAVDVVIGWAEPGGRLQEELAYFESIIVGDAVEWLESGKIGQAAIDEINSAAYARYRSRHQEPED